MAYFDLELKTTLLFTAAGIVAGVASFFARNTMPALAAAVVIYIVVHAAARKLGVKKDRKWWAGNAAVVYILVWFVAWTLLFNTVVL